MKMKIKTAGRKPKLSFSNLSPAELERLAILAEECGEVTQMVGKILRHGYESHHPSGGLPNRRLLEEELGHVKFITELMIRRTDVSRVEIDEYLQEKSLSVSQYLHHNDSLIL